MPKYYDISLKNSRVCQASDLRLNGLPLSGLHMITGAGRLEFVALPAVQSGARTIVGGFKSMSGMDSEVEFADPGVPGSRRRLRGRVTSAVTRSGSAARQEYEEVTFVYHTIV